MKIEKFERDVKSYYKTVEGEEKIAQLIQHIKDEWQLELADLTFNQLKIFSTTILEESTLKVHQELEDLLAQKEKLERAINRKSSELQHNKYSIFNEIEKYIDNDEVVAKLHQIKLQDIDLYDLLSEIVESAIIMTLEKNANDIEDILQEVTKDITYETLSEGLLSSYRIRKIITTILQVAIDIAEATPNMEEKILHAVIKGLRKGLVKAIERFKQQLLYMPDELKVDFINEHLDIESELVYTDELFASILNNLANNSSETTTEILHKVSSETNYDVQELIHISKETADVMRERLIHLREEAIKRSNEMLQSERAKEAKRLGIHAWNIAKAAMNGAVKSAKDAIDQEKK